MRTKFFSKNNIGKMPFEIIQMLRLTKQIIPDYYNSTICSPFVPIFLGELVFAFLVPSELFSLF